MKTCRNEAVYTAPFVLCAVLAMGMFAEWDRADSAERRAQGWEKIAREQAQGWEKIASEQGTALDNLMKADAGLKEATIRLQVACAAR